MNLDGNALDHYAVQIQAQVTPAQWELIQPGLEQDVHVDDNIGIGDLGGGGGGGFAMPGFQVGAGDQDLQEAQQILNALPNADQIQQVLLNNPLVPTR